MSPALDPRIPEIIAAFGFMAVSAMIPLPTEVAAAVAISMRHGFWLGLAIVWSGAMAGAVLTYGLARWLHRRIGWLTRSSAVRRAEARLAGLGWTGILTLRLIPLVPSSALSVSAGLLRLPFRAYLQGTALGILPAAVLLALLGEGLITEGTTRLVVIALALAALCGLVLRLRRRG